MNDKRLKRIVRIALFVAMALIMHFIESQLPPIALFVYGAKLGLANVVSLIAMIILGYLDALIVVVVRCLLGSLYGGGVQTLMISIPAGVMSLLVMILLYHFVFPHVSLMAISYIAAIVHNVTQLFVVSTWMSNISVLYMLPMMLVASVVAGLFVGIVAHYVVKSLPISAYRI